MTTATIVADIDNTMNVNSPDSNVGTAVSLSVTAIWAGGEKAAGARVLGNFDLSSIPEGATIDSAVLRLTIIPAGVSGDGARDAVVYRVLRDDWHEMQSTWNDYKTSNAWGGGGCGGLNSDYTETDEVAFSSPVDADEGNDFDITGMKTLVEDAIANRSDWLRVLLRFRNELEDQGNDLFQWHSKDDGTEARRWRLVVEYTTTAVAAPIQVMVY